MTALEKKLAEIDGAGSGVEVHCSCCAIYELRQTRLLSALRRAVEQRNGTLEHYVNELPGMRPHERTEKLFQDIKDDDAEILKLLEGSGTIAEKETP